MSHRPVDLLLEDIFEAVGRIDKYLTNSTQEKFLEDQMMQDAVIRNLTVTFSNDLEVAQGKTPR